MAGPSSNFEGEIRKSMKSPVAKTDSKGSLGKGGGGTSKSSNDVAMKDAPKGGNATNQWTKPPASASQPTDASAGQMAPGGVGGPDSGANLIAHGHAFVDAIHQHVNAMKAMGT